MVVRDRERARRPVLLLLNPGLAKITKVPFAVLGPGLVVIMLLGAFQESGQIGDLWIMIVLGLFGWLLKETGFPRAPFLIGFVLAIPLERYYFLTDSVYSGAEWMLRPWVLVFIAVLVIPGILALVKRIRARRKIGADDVHAEPPPKTSTRASWRGRSGHCPPPPACSPSLSPPLSWQRHSRPRPG